ncbi:hypothetical protein GQR58_026500 [Nymphon striatum]|nr:hypothetical protein GQR58_026500 [Nymphon striatum]
MTAVYDLLNDPTERINLKDKLPAILELLQVRPEAAFIHKSNTFARKEHSSGNPKLFGGVYTPGWCKPIESPKIADIVSLFEKLLSPGCYDNRHLQSTGKLILNTGYCSFHKSYFQRGNNLVFYLSHNRHIIIPAHIVPRLFLNAALDNLNFHSETEDGGNVDATTNIIYQYSRGEETADCVVRVPYDPKVRRKTIQMPEKFQLVSSHRTLKERKEARSLRSVDLSDADIGDRP